MAEDLRAETGLDLSMDQARQLEQMYQTGKMPEGKRPVWERQRARFFPAAAEAQATGLVMPRQSFAPGSMTRDLQPPPPLPAGYAPEPRGHITLGAITPADVRTGLEKGEQHGREQFESFATTVLPIAISGLIPASAAISAAEYAASSPAVRAAVWAAKEMLAPLVRAGTIGLGVGGVPLLMGKPMSEAVKTGLFTALGSFAGAKAPEGRLPGGRKLAEQLAEYPEGTTTREVLAQRGIPVSLGTRAGGEKLGRLESFLQTTVGGGPLRRRQRAGEEAMTGELQAMAPKPPTTLPPVAPDVLIQQTLEAHEQKFQTAATTLYDAVDTAIHATPPKKYGISMGQPTTVNIGDAQKIAADLYNDVQRAGVPTAGGLSILQAVMQKSPLMSFRDAQKMRSDLLKVTRDSTDLIPDRAAKYASSISGAVDKAMADTARLHGTDVYQAWRDANSFYKEGAEKFDAPIVGRLLRGEADKVLGLAAPPRSPYAIRQARQALDSPEVWNQVQEAWLHRTIGGVTSTNGRDINAQALLTQLTNPKTGMGEPALRELFPQGHGKQLIDFTTALAQLQRFTKQRGMLNRALHYAPEIGLVLPVYDIMRQEERGHGRDGEPGEGGGRASSGRVASRAVVTTIAIGPAILSRALASPTLTQFLIDGMKIEYSSSRRMEVAGAILGQLIGNGLLGSAPPSGGVNSPGANGPPQ